MFREMRRKRQILSLEESAAILDKSTSGVMAVSGDDNYPYTVPLSYIYDGDKLYFHCAKSGHMIDAIKRNSKVSFCVIDKDEVIPEEYTTYYRSVIVFGRIRFLEDDEEKRLAIEKLAIRYAPKDDIANRKKAIDRKWLPLCMLEMTIDHMTGKEAMVFVNRKAT